MKRLSDEEYRALREEINTRVQLMYSHNIGMVMAIFAVWAIAGLFCSEFFKLLQDKIAEGDGIRNSILTFGAVLLNILLISPMGILLPFSVRSRDNIGQIESLSGYLLVFAEIPTLMAAKKENKTNEKGKDGGLIGWEMLQQKAVNEKLTLPFFNCEYIILGFISLGLFLGSSVLFLYLSYQYRIMIPVLLLHIDIFVLCLSIFALCIIIKKSNVHNFSKRRKACVKKYGDVAIKYNFVSEEERKDFEEHINSFGSGVEIVR